MRRFALRAALAGSTTQEAFVALGIDFANLDLRAAFDFAIGIEEDAQLRYQEFTTMVSDPGAAAFFREMVENESKHRRQLEARRHVIFRHAAPRFEWSLDDDVEAPDPGEIQPSLSAREAMEVALRAEIRAYEFYASAIPHVKDPDVRAFFEELKAEEVEHQEAIRRKLEQLPADPVVRPGTST
jgi:erythrin-vacuolar iron transport family protein